MNSDDGVARIRRERRGFWRSAALATSAAAPLAASFTATPAAAQSSELNPPVTFTSNYFGRSAAISPRVAYSDNINLQPDGFKDSEVVASTLLTGSAIVSGSRFTGIASGDLDLSVLTDDGDFVVNQDIAGAGTAQLVENLFYFDVAGSSERQLAGDNAAFSPNVNAGRNQRVSVSSFQLSPYLSRRFPSGVAGEVRYRFSQSYTDNNVGGLFQGLLSDSQSQQLTAVVNSGTAFERLSLGFVAYGARNEETGSAAIDDFEYEQGSLLGEAEFAITDTFAATGAAGYDEISSDAPETLVPADQLSGFFWRAGFRARPGRKTDLKLEYGRRYDDDFINARLRYALNSRLQINAQANREFRSRAQAVSSARDAGQRQILEFAERLRLGDPQSVDGVLGNATQIRGRINAQTAGVGVRDVVSAGVFGAYDRTTLGVNVAYSDEDFNFRAIETVTGSAFAERRLSRRLSAYGSFFYRLADADIDEATCLADPSLFGAVTTTPGFDPVLACAEIQRINAQSTTVGGRVGARYQFFSNVAAFGEIGHSRRLSDEASIEFDETVVSAGVTLAF